jgi:hypothetical protein
MKRRDAVVLGLAPPVPQKRVRQAGDEIENGSRRAGSAAIVIC